MSKHLFLLLCILFFGAILRFIWLDRIPNSINGDQLYYILNSRSFILTGKDLTQSINPLDILIFRYPPNEFVQAELPIFLNLLPSLLTPFSLTSNALPTTTLSFLIIILMYLISEKLFNKQTALVAAFLTAINPWFIATGRTSYEMVTADFFYLCAFYVLLIAKRWRILLSLPFIFFAFYSYIATKLPLLPVIFTLCAYCYFVINKKKYGLQYILVLLLTTLFVGFFAFQVFTSKSSRASELITPFSPYISSQVDILRKTSIASPLLSIFENKLTVYVKTISSNIPQTISFDYLFMHGDYFFLQGRHGFFYMFDVIFLFIGASWLFVKNKKLFFFLATLFALSITPQIFHKTSLTEGNFSPHIALLIPFLIFFIAVGVNQTLTQFLKNKIAISIIFILFIFSVGNFINIYFFKMPLESNYYNFSDRLLSQYIYMNQKQNKNILVYATDEKGKFKHYLFYTNSYTKGTSQVVLSALKEKRYKIGNVIFLGCDKGKKVFNDKDIFILHRDCNMTSGKPNLSIPQISDSGRVYTVINDSLCSKFQLKDFVSGLKISDFDIEKMSPQQFCQTFTTSIL